MPTGASIGDSAGAIIGSGIPFFWTAFCDAIGGLVGVVIDVSGDIGDALSSVADAIGLNNGPGAARTALRQQLAPVFATIVRSVPPDHYGDSLAAIANALQTTLMPAFDVVAHFGDDPTFAADVMADVGALAPPPPGAQTSADYNSNIIAGILGHYGITLATPAEHARARGVSCS